jgi:hypothetical protein
MIYVYSDIKGNIAAITVISESIGRVSYEPITGNRHRRSEELLWAEVLGGQTEEPIAGTSYCPSQVLLLRVAPRELQSGDGIGNRGSSAIRMIEREEGQVS